MLIIKAINDKPFVIKRPIPSWGQPAKPIIDKPVEEAPVAVEEAPIAVEKPAIKGPVIPLPIPSVEAPVPSIPDEVKPAPPIPSPEGPRPEPAPLSEKDQTNKNLNDLALEAQRNLTDESLDAVMNAEIAFEGRTEKVIDYVKGRIRSFNSWKGREVAPEDSAAEMILAAIRGFREALPRYLPVVVKMRLERMWSAQEGQTDLLSKFGKYLNIDSLPKEILDQAYAKGLTNPKEISLEAYKQDKWGRPGMPWEQRIASLIPWWNEAYERLRSNPPYDKYMPITIINPWDKAFGRKNYDDFKHVSETFRSALEQAEKDPGMRARLEEMSLTPQGIGPGGEYNLSEEMFKPERSNVTVGGIERALADRARKQRVSTTPGEGEEGEPKGRDIALTDVSRARQLEEEQRRRGPVYVDPIAIMRNVFAPGGQAYEAVEPFLHDRRFWDAERSISHKLHTKDPDKIRAEMKRMLRTRGDLSPEDTAKMGREVDDYFLRKERVQDKIEQRYNPVRPVLTRDPRDKDQRIRGLSEEKRRGIVKWIADKTFNPKRNPIEHELAMAIAGARGKGNFEFLQVGSPSKYKSLLFKEHRANQLRNDQVLEDIASAHGKSKEEMAVLVRETVGKLISQFANDPLYEAMKRSLAEDGTLDEEDLRKLPKTERETGALAGLRNWLRSIRFSLLDSLMEKKS